MIRKVVIQNFKCYQNAQIEIHEGVNILVGNNEAGKSTILEAVNLALTARIGRYPIIQALSPHVLNRSASKAYLASLKTKHPEKPPEIIIELYLEDSGITAPLKGTNNLLKQDCPGVRLWIHFDQDYASEYTELLKDPGKIRAVPIEYYKTEWLAFSGATITQRSMKVSATLIDASKMRLQSGADFYLQRMIQESLTDAERVRLARAYADLKDSFAGSDGIKALNTELDKRKTDVTDKVFSLAMDTSPTGVWESSLVPHLDDLPFVHAGGGEQSTMKILLALTRKVEGSHIILIEEPENHLSFPRLNHLVDKIAQLCTGRQLLITTHSSYVLNKLGLKNLLLLKNQTASRVTDLPDDTQRYFMKLSGYDTLRMVLADRVILVEGPSDDLIVQRAHLDAQGCLPITRGTDVIAVRGLAFKRFLDIAVSVGTRVSVVTDNDGDPDAVTQKYASYQQHGHIKICYSKDATLKTLEPQLVACNSLADLNRALGSNHQSKEDVLETIGTRSGKTEAALCIFEATSRLTMPAYILEATQWVAQ